MVASWYLLPQSGPYQGTHTDGKSSFLVAVRGNLPRRGRGRGWSWRGQNLIWHNLAPQRCAKSEVCYAQSDVALPSCCGQFVRHVVCLHLTRGRWDRPFVGPTEPCWWAAMQQHDRFEGPTACRRARASCTDFTTPSLECTRRFLFVVSTKIPKKRLTSLAQSVVISPCAPAVLTEAPT